VAKVIAFSVLLRAQLPSAVCNANKEKNHEQISAVKVPTVPPEEW
jgi:hypothetical protein